MPAKKDETTIARPSDVAAIYSGPRHSIASCAIGKCGYSMEADDHISARAEMHAHWSEAHPRGK